jgi:hypothetical protein
MRSEGKDWTEEEMMTHRIGDTVEALLLTVVNDGDTVGDEGKGEGGEDELRIDCRVGETGKIVVLHKGSKNMSVLKSRRGGEVSRILREEQRRVGRGTNRKRGVDSRH